MHLGRDQNALPEGKREPRLSLVDSSSSPLALCSALELMYTLYLYQIWSKIIALHGLNGIESTVLKYRNV